MGKAGNNSILKGLSGKVGPVSVTGNKNRSIVRIRPDKPKRKGAREGTSQHAIFTLVGRFFYTLPAGFFKKGYLMKVKDGSTPLGASKSYHMKNAVVGTYPDLSMDLSKLKFSGSQRPIESGWNAELNSLETDGLQVTWEINPYPEKKTQLDDEAVIVFYNLNKRGFRYVEGIPRSNCSYIFPATPFNQGNSVACWIFFVSADKKLVSDTQYLGIVAAGV